MPALAALREASSEDAEELLLLGLSQDLFSIRSLSCAGLGMKPTAAGREALVRALKTDNDPNVRSEAANALVSHGFNAAWPVILEAFELNNHWLVRCSILAAVAENPDIKPEQLLQLAQMGAKDNDGTVRVSVAQILGLLVSQMSPKSAAARAELQLLLTDEDYRVVAAALNGLSA